MARQAVSEHLDELLSLIICPVHRGPLELIDGDEQEGLLCHASSGLVYPIIGGVPRLLPPALLHPFLRGAYPWAYERWPELMTSAALAQSEELEPAVLETLIAYEYHHLDLNDETLMWEEWRQSWDRFQPKLAPESLSGLRALEVGCGEGRHARLVSRAGARCLVGLDLSRGVERARSMEPNPAHHFIQGDLRSPPLREGSFDCVYSNGVLHHTPEPIQSFKAVAPLARPGGEVSVWVYGLDEMRWSYKVSHLVWLRPITDPLPRSAKLMLSGGLTLAVEAALWTPARLLKRVGLSSLAERIPYHDAASQGWEYKLRRMFDRLNPPITHYISRSELLEWFEGLEEVEVINADGQGWSARGRWPSEG